MFSQPLARDAGVTSSANMNSLPGQATPQGTAEYQKRHASPSAPGHFRALQGLSLSSIGIGTYLGSDDDADDTRYRDAVVRALERGLNVIDTAINYRSQRSERAVGAALRLASERGLARRDQVVVATKGGYLPFDGRRPRDFRAYLEETWMKPGVFTVQDLVAGCHCMTPRYLKDQLGRSLQNLGLQTIDVYYLHNPETQLDEVPRPEFLRRLRAAFETLEAACAEGKIGLYGTATWNGYRERPGAPGHLALRELTDLAREVAGDGHHLRALQLPYNLAMPEAFVLPTQEARGRPAPLLEAAAEAGIYVMTSASILQGRLARGLPAEVRQKLDPRLPSDAQRALQFVRSTPGVGTALAGMKRLEHVDENAGVAAVDPTAPETIRSLFQ